MENEGGGRNRDVMLRDMPAWHWPFLPHARVPIDSFWFGIGHLVVAIVSSRVVPVVGNGYVGFGVLVDNGYVRYGGGISRKGSWKRGLQGPTATGEWKKERERRGEEWTWGRDFEDEGEDGGDHLAKDLLPRLS